MKLAPRQQKVSVELNSENFEIDPRVWSLFQKLAGLRLELCMEEACKLVAQGKSPNRALADALGTFKLV